jgi:hypothetical protein
LEREDLSAAQQIYQIRNTLQMPEKSTNDTSIGDLPETSLGPTVPKPPFTQQTSLVAHPTGDCGNGQDDTYGEYSTYDRFGVATNLEQDYTGRHLTVPPSDSGIGTHISGNVDQNPSIQNFDLSYNTSANSSLYGQTVPFGNSIPQEMPDHGYGWSNPQPAALPYSAVDGCWAPDDIQRELQEEDEE